MMCPCTCCLIDPKEDVIQGEAKNLLPSHTHHLKDKKRKMESFSSSESQVAAFNETGYLMVETLFDREEMDLLRDIAHADRRLAEEARDRLDAQGGVTKLS